MPGKNFTRHLKEPLSWPLRSSWMCHEAETKAERVGLHLGLIWPDGCWQWGGGTMIVRWIKHKLLRVRTGSSRWGSQEVTSVQQLLLWWAGFNWPCQLSGEATVWRAELVPSCVVCGRGGGCTFKFHSRELHQGSVDLHLEAFSNIKGWFW